MRKRLFLRLALAALLSVGMYALAAPAPAARAAADAGHALVTRFFGPSAIATFTDQYTNASGQVVDVVVMIGISQGIQQPPGKPTGAMETVSIIEYNTVTEMGLNGIGEAPLPSGATIDGENLTSAYLPANEVEIRPTGDNPDAFDPYLAEVGPVSWTGVGDISFSPLDTSHLLIPHVLSLTIHTSAGTSRMATAVATSLSYPSPLSEIDVTLTHLNNNPGPFEMPTELANGSSIGILVMLAPLPPE